MPRKGSAQPAEKEQYVFLVEADQAKGINENHVHVITKLVSDKVFSESSDLIAISRLDKNSLQFEVASWNLLKTFVKTSSVLSKQKLSNGTQLVDSILQTCETVSINAVEDNFTANKILVFANFTNYILDADQINILKQRAEADNILLTFVFPVEEEEMNQAQKNCFKRLKNSVGAPSSCIYVHTYKSCLGRVLNIVANKAPRSLAWKAVLEIGSGIEIPVKKLIVNRKTTALLKNRINKATKDLEGNVSGNKKEIAWLENDGTAIDYSEVGNAYSYGDKLVTIADKTPYETGEKCLQLLVFCPRENILPVYLVGVGADILFPQDDDDQAALKFDALLKALVNTQTVAVVKKVQTKNARISLCVLSPDTERQGLIMTEMCFADDISIPHFPNLIKETFTEEDGLTEKDALIDELIGSKSMDEFNPSYGPVNPKIRIFRDHVTQKIVSGEGKPRIQDNVQLFFSRISTREDVIARMQSEFPLAIKKEPASDRPSGMQVFRRGSKTDDETTNGSYKRLKLVDAAAIKAEEDEQPPESAQDIDDLMDDL